MPNVLDGNGLQVQTRAELIAFYTSQYQAIYGADINLDSDSPDGQWMNLQVQATLDLLDLLVQIYNAQDPDNAIGVVLDQRCAINGIERQAGTYTVTPITLVNSQSINLYGLDQSVQPVYTIADNAGTQWELITTVLGLAAGSHVMNFRAALPGATLTTPNTINVPVTVVLGVTSINNPTTYSTLGINEETDAALKLRRQKSVSKVSQGYLAGLLAALEDINGVTSAFIYENRSDLTDGDGVPGHSIWVIVAGTAAASAIANAIYTKRNAGAGMFGAISLVITQVDGSPFTVLWDVVTEEDLYVKFTVSSLDGTTPPNIAAIRSGLVTSFAPGVNATVNINELATDVQAIDPNTLVTGAGFSLAATGPFTNTLAPSSKKNQFRVSSPNIIIVPMQLSPSMATVVTGATKQFTGLGGYGAYTYSLTVNNSGGSINPTTGLYTAGPTTGVTDTVHVQDTQANTATAPVNVIP